MTDGQRSVLLRAWLNHLAHGASTRVTPNGIESDRRKQTKTIREILKAGYLTWDRQPSSDALAVTSKVWDELTPEPVSLTGIWEVDRTSGWNKRRQVPLVRFQDLTWGQKKTVLSSPASYQWHVCNSVPLGYDSPIQDGDVAGPVADPDRDLGSQIAALDEQVVARLKERGRGEWFPNTEVVLKSDELTAHVQKTLADEMFVAIYQKNLTWGLARVGVVSDEDAGEVTASDEPGWILGGGSGGNLGTDPAKWGDALQERIAATRESIERRQKRLAVMEQIAAGVERMGGWDAFRSQYREKLVEELAARMAKANAGE